jgi:hypothetical protein
VSGKTDGVMKMKCEGENATIIQHCAVFGNLKTYARKFTVHDPKPRAQYATSVSVSFVEPRKRNSKGFTMVPDNLRYLTIERDGGEVLYDSRDDVPCDMAKFEPIYQKHKAEWLERQVEIDRRNAADPNCISRQMGDFRD